MRLCEAQKSLLHYLREVTLMLYYSNDDLLRCSRKILRLVSLLNPYNRPVLSSYRFATSRGHFNLL